MQRVLEAAFLVVFAAAGALTLYAQQGTQDSAAVQRRATDFALPFIGPVAGAPVTATYMIHMERPLDGGGTESLYSSALVARDGAGRTRHERRGFVPALATAEPPLLGLFLIDPQSNTIQAIDAIHRTSREQPLPATNTRLAASGGDVEDLGRKPIDGIEAKGVRRTWEVPAESSATGQAGQVVVETWYSDELHMIVSQRRTGPSGQVVLMTLTNVDRSEPAAALFKTPKGYQAVKQNGLAKAGGPSRAPDMGCSTTPASYDPHDPYSGAPCGMGYTANFLPR